MPWQPTIQAPKFCPSHEVRQQVTGVPDIATQDDTSLFFPFFLLSLLLLLAAVSRLISDERDSVPSVPWDYARA